MSREERIAARLVTAIYSLMPDWCAFSIHADRLEVAINGRFDVSIGLGWDERDPDVLAFNVLNTIQDAIVRSSRNPWPPTGEPTRLPLPAAVVRDGRLVAWFGPETRPDVAIPPIDLATV